MIFSIIIPVYNVELYLDECVKSVLNQSFQDYELFLIDDGSTDSSGAICDKWAERDARIKVIHQTNGGLSSARNTGIARVSGTYIIFLDSDDYWLYTSVLDDIFERVCVTQPDVLVFNHKKNYGGTFSKTYFRESLRMPTNLSSASSEKYIFEHDLWTACAWNKVVNARLFYGGRLRFRENITAEDVDWCYRLALEADRFDFLNINVVAYRQRESSISGSVNADKIQCLLINILTCLDLSKTTEAAKSRQLMGYISFQYGTLLYGYAMLRKSMEKQSMLRKIKELKYLLDYSNNRKIRLIRFFYKCVGFRNTVTLLSIKSFFQKVQNRRRS